VNEIGLVFQTREKEKSLGELGVMNNCLWMRVAHYFLLQAFLRSSSEVIGLSFQIFVFKLNSDEIALSLEIDVDLISASTPHPFKKESSASNLD
jgi:hypothetical protein